MLLKHVAAGSSEAVIIAQIQTSWSKFVRLYITRRIFCRRHKAFFLNSSVLQTNCRPGRAAACLSSVITPEERTNFPRKRRFILSPLYREWQFKLSLPTQQETV